MRKDTSTNRMEETMGTRNEASWRGRGARALGTLVAVGMMVGGALTAHTRDAHADEAVPAAAEGVVNVNTATPDQLGLLPGIGETKARAIVEFRQRRPFARVDDLVSVRGIGRATLRRLRPYLTVRGETTLTRAVAGARPAPTPSSAAAPVRGPASPRGARPGAH